MAALYRTLPILTEQDTERFWSKVQKGADDECWPWMARRDGDGYGFIWLQGDNYKAHRVALFLKLKTDFPEYQACHACDNPPCCNPAHLFKGTPQDNSNDMVNKGRSPRPDLIPAEKRARGERSGMAILTENDVREIHRLIHVGWLQRDIAKRFNINQTHVSAIKHGRIWAHIKPEKPHRFAHGLQIHDEIKPRGEKNPRAKLTTDNVREIRHMLKNGATRRTCAERFGVSDSTIGWIKKGATWTDIE